MTALPPIPPPNEYPQLSPQAEISKAITTHVLSIFFGWLSSLIMYSIYKNRGPFVRSHVIRSLNFQLTILIVGAIPVVLSVSGPQIFIFLAWSISIFKLVFEIIAAITAKKGQYYKFPISFKLIKE